MALNAYLKLDQIDGEAGVTGFVGQIEVLSFDWTTERPDNGLTLDPPVHGDLVVKAQAGRQSPLLVDRLKNNQPIKTGDLSLARVDQKTGQLFKYMTFSMTDCLVSSYRLSDGEGSGVESLSVEAFTLRWNSVTFTAPPSSAGSTTSPSSAPRRSPRGW